MLVGEDAGILIRSDHNVLERLRLRDVLFGMYLWGADDNVIAENTITGREELGVGERGSGVHIYNSHRNNFRSNSIQDVRDGFYIQYANHTVIVQCEVFNVRYGLHYMYADSNIFLQNSFHDNLAGAAIMYSKGIVMRRNVFRDNTGFSSYGILFQDCHDLDADSNSITNNTIGMFLEASTGNRFRHNLIARNTVALQMFQNSTGNTFSKNDFIDNLSPLSIVGRRTESQWSVSGTGNYWSTYDGYDIDHDAIGDVPMRIVNVFQYLEGQNPAARLYLYSPASQSLAFAAQSFPIFDRNEEVDFHPMMEPTKGGLLAGVKRNDRKTRPAPGWAVLPVAFLMFSGFVYYRISRREA
jgi:nitrous oxidase accessory protein